MLVKDYNSKDSGLDELQKFQELVEKHKCCSSVYFDKQFA